MKKIQFVTIAALAMTAFANIYAGAATEWYKKSSIDARLNVTVKPDTDVVHFVRDVSDPNVVTKAYALKYADPYELRTYLRKIVQTRKITENPTNIQAVKFTDGKAILLISAEDYRFEDSSAGQGFDTLVKILDQPQTASITGRPMYVYSPKFRSAAELQEMINEVGAFKQNEAMDNLGGTDKLVTDNGLNLIFFKTSPFSRQTIVDVLKEYDKPYPEVYAQVTVYELYAENDAKIGLDFQAWKNNDGINFFNTGAHFMRNHNAANLVKGLGWESIRYFRFNPKWNTKYLDFLTSKGKARVMHTAAVKLRNNESGVIRKVTGTFVTKAEPIETGKDQIQHGNKIETQPTEFGFEMKMTPSITEKATILKVVMGNSSLIGYTSTGAPRIQKAAVIDTQFMIDNKGTKLVIGGLEKRDVVRVSGGLPILKDLPVFGWLFSTEQESTKRSQLVVVAEVVPAAAIQKEVNTFRKDTVADLKAAGETNTFGFRQYGLDENR
ncbi:MAG: hypothetical protein IKB16_09545 [Lentisphaeria bacterium]|nr:hypothetical protein [Lentisphaeria bacterium]